MLTESTLLDHILDPVLGGDVGQRLLDFRIDEKALSRLEVLRERANEGLLTPSEAAEYDRVVDRLDLIAIIKAEARAAIARRSAP